MIRTKDHKTLNMFDPLDRLGPRRRQLLEKIGCSEHRVLKGTRVSNGLMTPKSDCILHPVDFLRIWFLPIVKRERIFQSNDYFIRPPSRDYLISSQVFLYFLNKGQERFLENQTACVYPASLSEIIMSQRLNGICASPPQRDYGVKHLRKKQGLGRLV